MTEIWDDKADHLAASRTRFHNEDYWRFLVREVWRIDRDPCRLADFGCGAGWGGLFLMPMLAAGSDYTGVDRSEPLLEQARARFAALPYGARFFHGDVSAAAPFEDDQFDVSFAHTVMMHLPEPRRTLAEMIRVTRDGGLVITGDASRNAINALIHVHETDSQDHVPLSLFQAMNAETRRRSGVDYNIGMKMPVLMHQAGLRDVQARVSDAVRLVFPPLDTPAKENLFQGVCDDGLGGYPADEESFQRTLAALVARGAPEAAAAAELRREMAGDYRRRGRDYHTVQPGLITLSFGWVSKR